VIRCSSESKENGVPTHGPYSGALVDPPGLAERTEGEVERGDPPRSERIKDIVGLLEETILQASSL
jgi:hypothetical protein